MAGLRKSLEYYLNIKVILKFNFTIGFTIGYAEGIYMKDRMINLL